MVLEYRIELLLVFNIAGWLLFFFGTFLHIWSGILLSFWGLIGLPEVSDKFRSKMVTTGPFSVLRHPTYLAHIMIFVGIFLLSGIVVTGLIAVLDILISLLVIIPLEERELLRRFGAQYREYSRNVPKILPKLH